MSLDWIKSDQDSGAQKGLNILLPAHSCEWVGFSFLKSRANLQYFTGSSGFLLGPVKKTITTRITTTMDATPMTQDPRSNEIHLISYVMFKL